MVKGTDRFGDQTTWFKSQSKVLNLSVPLLPPLRNGDNNYSLKGLLGGLLSKSSANSGYDYVAAFHLSHGGWFIEVQVYIPVMPHVTWLASYPGIAPVSGRWYVSDLVGNNQGAYFYFQFTQN